MKKIYLFFIILFGFYIVFAYNLELTSPDEYRYAVIPIEMMHSHNYFTPTLNGLKYFEKPILYYYSAIVSYKIFGINNFSVRFPSLISAFLIIYFTGQFYKKYKNYYTSVLTVIFLSSSILFFCLSQIATTDMFLSLFMTLAFFNFYHYYKTNKNKYLFYFNLYASFGYLTKGLIGFVLPFTISFIFLLIYDRKKVIKFIFNPINLISIFFLIGYLVLMEIINPGHFDFFIMDQHIRRFASTSEHNEPIYYYCGVILLGFIPFSILFFKKIKNAFKNHLTAYSLIWIIFILFFFSLAKSKVATYMLPIIPQLAFILALNFKDLKLHQKLKYILWFTTSQILLGIILIIVAFKLTSVIDILTVFTIVVLFIFIISIQQKFKKIIYKLAVAAYIFIITMLLLYPQISLHLKNRKTFKSIDMIFQNLKNNHYQIFGYKTYLHALNYYQQQQVKLINYQGELKYGIEHSDKKVYYNISEFKKYLKNYFLTIYILVRNNQNKQELKELLTNYKYKVIFNKKKYAIFKVN